MRALLRLGSVLLNLLTNAAKHTTEGSITLSATVVGESPSSYRLQFSVEDTGCGVPEGSRDAIFEEFGQAGEGILFYHFQSPISILNRYQENNFLVAMNRAGGGGDPHPNITRRRP